MQKQTSKETGVYTGTLVRIFNHIHKNGAFFVTRAKDNMLYEVVEFRGYDPEAGITIGDTKP